jgi:hypothetical protein
MPGTSTPQRGLTQALGRRWKDIIAVHSFGQSAPACRVASFNIASASTSQRWQFGLWLLVLSAAGVFG